MKKALLFIAIAAILLTIVLGAFHIRQEVLQEDPMASPDVKRFSGIHEVGQVLILIAIIACEIGLFSGIALLLSKNRTPLKVISGIVIVMISSVFLVEFTISFLGLNRRYHEEPMAYMLLSERLSGLSL